MNSNSKLIPMQEAVHRYVTDGATIAIEGFTAFICFAAAHEIIRQRKQNLTLARMTPAGLAHVGPAAVRLARAEGLEAHALSVEARLERLNEAGRDA